jgi:hypothetical protein
VENSFARRGHCVAMADSPVVVEILINKFKPWLAGFFNPILLLKFS